MYIHQEKKRKSSVYRVLLLTILILTGLWFISDQPEWAKPFEPEPTPTRPASYYVNDGDILFAEGALSQAIDAYEQAISLEPENDIPYRKQSKMLILTGDTAKALVRAEQAVLLNPDNAENLAGYCQALDWEGQYGAAFDACECAIEVAPDDALGYAHLSEVYTDQNDWYSARTTAQQAIETDFQSPEAHHIMGYALEYQGRYAEAVEFYENAITLRPNLAPYYMAAGRNYYWLGNFEKAAEMFGEAIKLDPTNSVGYDQLGWAYHTNGEDTRAVDALEQAISVDPTNARAWGRLGTIYYLRQNYEEALKVLPTAVELSEHQLLSKIRRIELLTQIEGPAGPETVSIISGRFEPDDNNQHGTMVAQLVPIRWEQDASPEQIALTTCGQLIASNIHNQIILTSPIQDISFSNAFSQTTGTATLSLTTGKLTLKLENLPRPQEIPYEAQIQYQQSSTESLGYFQPDAQNRVDEEFLITTTTSAPVEYYYELGLSYAYLYPPDCETAVPWLLKSLEKNDAYYNPAWEGLRICPSENSPPTPLPTFTPPPEDEGN